MLALNLLIPGGEGGLNRFANRKVCKTRIKNRSPLAVLVPLTEVASNISVFTEIIRLRLKWQLSKFT